MQKILIPLLFISSLLRNVIIAVFELEQKVFFYEKPSLEFLPIISVAKRL